MTEKTTEQLMEELKNKVLCQKISFLAKEKNVSVLEAAELWKGYSDEQRKEVDEAWRQSAEEAVRAEARKEEWEKQERLVKEAMYEFERAVPKRFRDARLDEFKGTPFERYTNSAANMEALWLCLGSNGIGKTRFAWSLMRDWSERGGKCRLMTATEFASYVRYWMQNRQNPCEELDEISRRYDRIIIDEIDKMRGTDSELHYLLHLVNTRYEQEKQLFLFGNCETGDAEELVGKSAFSRLTGDGALPPTYIKGQDRRMK